MTLAARLQEQHHRLEALLVLLDRERALLSDGTLSGEALEEVATDKQALLTALDEFEQRRRTVRQQLGYPDDASGDEQAAREQGCLELWRTLRARARDAARLNHLNGNLVNLRMTGNQRLLDDLHALAGRDLYGPDGQARGGAARLSSRA